MLPALFIIISLILSTFFSGMEIAYISSNRLKIELDRKHGGFSSRIIKIFLNNPEQFIATMLAGNTISLVIFGFYMTRISKPLLLQVFNTSSNLLLLIVPIIIGTLIILFTAEFMTRTFFRNRPNLSLKLFSGPVIFFYLILYPVTLVAMGITNLILAIIPGSKPRMNSESRNPLFGKIDLDHLVNESQAKDEENGNEEPEKKIFQNALEFSKLKVRDCMVPRTEIEALEINSSLDELKKRFTETGYSKILIFEESIDNIIGYISSKELFKRPTSIKSNLVPLSFVPETMNVNKLFRKLIKERKTIALVVDEYGGTSGIITLEDIIEEIFGEIEDEHDTVEFIERQINENEFVFSGRLEIDYLNDKYHFNIPVSEEYDTLAGYIIHHHKSIPKLNNIIVIEDFQYRILKVSQTRIELVHAKRIIPE